MEPTPRPHSFDQKETSEKHPTSSMLIRVARGNIFVKTEESSEIVYTENELRLGISVLDYIKTKIQSLDECELIEHKLSMRNSSLPFWFDQPFAIVLREIITNSIRAILLKEDREGNILITTYLDREKESFVISIADNGIGFGEHKPADLMREGVTTKKDPFPSTVGNGLFRSSRFVKEILNGTLDLSRNLGVTRCTISFPLQ